MRVCPSCQRFVITVVGCVAIVTGAVEAAWKNPHADIERLKTDMGTAAARLGALRQRSADLDAHAADRERGSDDRVGRSGAEACSGKGLGGTEVTNRLKGRVGGRNSGVLDTAEHFFFREAGVDTKGWPTWKGGLEVVARATAGTPLARTIYAFAATLSSIEKLIPGLQTSYSDYERAQKAIADYMEKFNDVEDAPFHREVESWSVGAVAHGANQCTQARAVLRNLKLMQHLVAKLGTFEELKAEYGRNLHTFNTRQRAIAFGCVRAAMLTHLGGGCSAIAAAIPSEPEAKPEPEEAS